MLCSCSDNPKRQGGEAFLRREAGNVQAKFYMPSVIELQDLRVKLGLREILQGVSCRLGVSGAGKAIGLLGPKAAGESTLILTLLVFQTASAGSARVPGLYCP